MWNLIVPLAFLIPFLAQSGPASRPSGVKLVLYAPAFKVEKGELIDLALEVSNAGDSEVVVAGDVRLERVTPHPPGTVNMERVEENKPPEDGKVRLTLSCAVPAGSMKRFIVARDLNHHQLVPDIYVPPGKSALIKVGLPADAFEIGACSVTASCNGGEVKSKQLDFQCVAPAEAKH